MGKITNPKDGDLLAKVIQRVSVWSHTRTQSPWPKNSDFLFKA